MQKIRWKQVIVSIIGVLLCKVSVFGCYPFIAGYFAAVYLEEKCRWLFSVAMLAAIAAFLPISAIAKYGMAMLVIAAAIHLCEWVNKKCYTMVAAIAASAGIFLLSVFGGLMDFKNQISLFLAFLEAVFVFGFVILGARGLQAFLEETESLESDSGGKDIYKAQRLLNYAESFSGLSKTFLTMERHFGAGAFLEQQSLEQSEEMGRMQTAITGKICAGCDACAVCWEPDNPTMYQVFSHMLGSLLQGQEKAEEAAAELKNHCMYSEHILQEASAILEQTQLNRAWYNRLLENREVIAQQLDAMAYIMQDCANDARLLDGEEKLRLSEIRYRAKEYGVVVETVHIYQKTDGHKQVVLRVHSKWGNCVAVKLLTKVVTAVMDRHMCPHKDARTFVGKDSTEIIYEEEPRFHALHGVSRLVKDGALVSGDNFSYMEKADGELLLCLSDGMGFGMRACRESEVVVDLIERFVEAGFRKETAIKMLNSAMVIRGEDEQYSTVDVISVNLFNGRAEFYKIGAAPTFIRHPDGSVECLVSTSLPAGVCMDIEIERASKQLRNGDFLVMVTDGVLEYLQTKQPEETMQEIISGIRSNHPGLLAKKILDEVMRHTGGAVQDDMTVLAAAIWEK